MSRTTWTPKAVSASTGSPHEYDVDRIPLISAEITVSVREMLGWFDMDPRPAASSSGVSFEELGWSDDDVKRANEQMASWAEYWDDPELDVYDELLSR